MNGNWLDFLDFEQAWCWGQRCNSEKLRQPFKWASYLKFPDPCRSSESCSATDNSFTNVLKQRHSAIHSVLSFPLVLFAASFSWGRESVRNRRNCLTATGNWDLLPPKEHCCRRTKATTQNYFRKFVFAEKKAKSTDKTGPAVELTK